MCAIEGAVRRALATIVPMESQKPLSSPSLSLNAGDGRRDAVAARDAGALEFPVRELVGCARRVRRARLTVVGRAPGPLLVYPRAPP